MRKKLFFLIMFVFMGVSFILPQKYLSTSIPVVHATFTVTEDQENKMTSSKNNFKKAEDELEKATDYFLSILHSVSYLLIIVGIGLFVLSMKNDDPHSKERAITVLVIAAVLFGLS